MKTQTCDPVKSGKRLTELRGIMTRVGVARKLGLSNSSLASYERGDRNPPDNVKIKLSEFYGVPVEQIFFQDD